VKRLLASPGLTIRCQVLLGALFVWAGASKVFDPGAFACAISQYQLPLLSPASVRTLAVVLPWIELVVGLALFFAVFGRSGALLLAFTGIEAAAMARGLAIDCGCFGPGGAKVGWGTLLRNLGMLLLAAQIVAFARPAARSPRKRGGMLPRPPAKANGDAPPPTE
jgi:uncharacterized membrane protein YphA (DoxX/SURF4 family)